MADALCNARVMLPSGLRDDVCVVIDGGAIRAVSSSPPPDARIVDCAGRLLLPGFIDTQVNGGGDRLFNDDPSVETIATIAAAHRRFGTTGLLPTLISDDLSVVEAGIAAVDAAIEAGVPGVLGIHVEGPFLSPKRHGIHLEAKLRAFDDTAIDLLTSARHGRTLVTLAPERATPGQIARLVEAGVIVAAGHSDADYETVRTAIDADFGQRAKGEVLLAETVLLKQEIDLALARGRRWMKPQRRATGKWLVPARARIVPQPLGVVGIVAPWNYPLYLAAAPLVDALVAGNRAMIKMPELTPRFSSLFAELVADAFPADEVAVVNGDADVGRAFTALAFDHLLFTGSTAVGRHVMKAAAANLTPVTLELGGKSPALIGPNARFEHAVERIVIGKLMNAGQTCIAPDYVLLPRARVDAFVDAARAAVARLYPDLPRNPQYSSIVSERHFARLRALRDDAVAAGASAHRLGDADDTGRRVMTPTLLTHVDDGMEIMRQEIFGPLLPLVAYDTLDEAIAYVASHPHPLALYVFEDDRAILDRIQRATTAGGVTVNDTILHIAQHRLPFGGVGASGMGAYHGEAGFRTFSRMTPVMRQARFNAVSLLNPPYGRMARALLKIVLR